MATPTILEKLNFYRDEVKHEFNLLAMRSNILITCQSFLVVPFAILNTAPDFRLVCLPIILVALLGCTIAFIIKKPILSAHMTIELWLNKQRELIAQNKEELKDFAINRDFISGVTQDINKDKVHIESLAFSKKAPNIFLTFWILAIISIVMRAYFSFSRL